MFCWQSVREDGEQQGDKGKIWENQVWYICVSSRVIPKGLLDLLYGLEK